MIGGGTTENAKRDIIPKRMVCPNNSCFGSFTKRNRNAKYCEECGTELEVRPADMYIDVSFEKHVPQTDLRGYPTKDDVPKDVVPPQEPKIRMSIRDIARAIREYEKEDFLEGV